MTDRKLGSSLDDFLADEGILEEATSRAQKKVLAWQIGQAMKEQKISKRAMAKRMNTSHAAVLRLLNPDNTSVTLRTMQRAAAVLGKQVRLELVDAPAPKKHESRSINA
jgi:transcriptional regulator with XRE-family HTH domain